MSLEADEVVNPHMASSPTPHNVETGTDFTEDEILSVISTIPVLPPLPPLLESPTAYSGSCLALSNRLVAYLQTLLSPPPCVALSIGSGFGLLEAYLMASTENIHVIGVEVEPSPNKYLPASHHRIVNGTRFLEPLAAQVTTWLFVYPRRVGLVQEYMAAYGEGSVKSIVWAGPKADWDDYRTCFAGWHVQEQEAHEVGGRAWELIAIANKPA